MRLEITDMRTITDETPQVRDLEFRNKSVAIGSHSKSQVQIPDVQLAAHHATLEPVGDNWFYQPTTRDDGQTKINGQPVDGRVKLSDGDVIAITYFEIKFTLEPEIEVVLPEPGQSGELAMIRNFPLPPRSTVRKPDADVSLTPERQKAFALLSLELARCPDLPRLLERTTELLETELSARMVWMGVRKDTNGPVEFVEGRLDGASAMIEPPKLETYVYRCLKRTQFIIVPRTGDGVTQSVLAVPILSDRGAIGLLFADTARRTRVFDEADLDFLTITATILAPILDAMLLGSSPSLAALGGGGIGFDEPLSPRTDPATLPQWPKLQLAQFSAAGSQTRGDFFDLTRMPNGLAAVIVGRLDTDPELTAQRIAEVRGAVRIASLHADPPGVQLRALNWMLSDDTNPCSLDAAIVVINPKTGAAEISSAGAIGAVMIREGGKTKRLTGSDVPPVGNGKTVEYASTTTRIRDGETLALYTPGVLATEDETGGRLDRRQLRRALGNTFGQPADGAIDRLLSDLEPYLKNANPTDDITLLLGHRPA